MKEFLYKKNLRLKKIFYTEKFHLEVNGKSQN